MPQGYQDPLTGEWISTDLDPFSAAFAPNGQAPLSVPGQRINGPGAPTNLPMQRPSGVGIRPGDVDTPGGAYGGGAPSGPLQFGPGRGPSGPAPHVPNYGPAHPDGSPSSPPVYDTNSRPSNAGGGDQGPGFWQSVYDKLWNGSSAVGNMLPDPRTIGVGPAIGPGGALPMGSGMSPAMAPAGDGSTRGPGSDASAPLTGGGDAPQMGMPWAGNNGGRPYGVGPGAQGGGGGARGGGGGGGGARQGGGSRGGAAPRLAPPPGAAPIVTQPGWGMIDRPNANPGIGGGMLGGAQTGGARGVSADPKMGAFDLSSLFNHPAIAAAAAAHPNVQARIPAPASAPRTAPRSAIAAPTPTPATGGPGPIDPSIIAQQKRRLPTTPAGYGDQSWLYGNQPSM